MTEREPTNAEVRAFKRATATLARLGLSGLYLYMQNDTLHLMTGPSHDEQLLPRDDRVRASTTISRAGGGDW